MSDAERIHCARCEREDVPPTGRAPFPNELGRRVAEEICVECWEAWKRQQMLLINHYGLNLMDVNAREFLLQNMKSFLFAEGPAGAEIDTSQEGNVSW
ncbi:MAG: oxidative damage protection protein [Gemmatimonadota bacterium]